MGTMESIKKNEGSSTSYNRNNLKWITEKIPVYIVFFMIE